MSEFLTEEQGMIRDMVRDFSESELKIISLNNFDFFATLMQISTRDLLDIFNKFLFLILTEFFLAGIMQIVLLLFFNIIQMIYLSLNKKKYL